MTTSAAAAAPTPAPRTKRSRDLLAFIRANQLYAVYLLESPANTMTKIGIADDPLRRLGQMQVANWAPLDLHAYWWTPGRPVAVRIEAEVLQQLAAHLVRDTWLKLPAPAVERTLKAVAARLPTRLWTDAELQQDLSVRTFVPAFLR